jgi:hypothetical protein
MWSAAIMAAAAIQSTPSLTFTRWPSSPEPTEIIEVYRSPEKAKASYFFKRTMIDRKVRSEWWTDTIECPAAEKVLLKAQSLPMPQVYIPFLTSKIMRVIHDGTTYQIKGLAKYPGATADEVAFSSNADTPLAKWVDESLKALSHCWSRSRPVGIN